MSTIQRRMIQRRLILLGLLLLAAGVFGCGLNWGLPSRDADRFLFNGRVPWSGKQIMELAGAWDTTQPRGADIAMHPLERADQPIVMNDTDAKRAEIVRRYRLYSNQPDEMITFRALSRMKPSKLDFDPTLYQYGGLWIYPIGGLLKLGAMVHLISLQSDLTFYLDHPEAFARFYLMARGYSVLWGLIGVAVVLALGQELTESFFVGVTAALLFITMPVVIDLSHEAKPHLAGTVLTLLTILMGAKYVRTGIKKWLILAGMAAGAAMGMVLTGYVAFAVLPVMVLLRSQGWRDRSRLMIQASLLGLIVFGLSNPYFIFNLVFHRGVLNSNVGNYGTFYRPSLSVAGIKMAGQSLLEGLSLAPLIVGGMGLLLIGKSGCKSAWLIDAVCLPMLVQFVLLAEGKTAEYARFALTIDVCFALFAAGLLDRLPISAREKAMASALLIAATFFFGIRYDINFLADMGSRSSRIKFAEVLQDMHYRELHIFAEPAPYCLPPVDLFSWPIVLEPRPDAAHRAGAELPFGSVGVRAVDFPTSNRLVVLSPISWANKPFEITHGSAALVTDRFDGIKSQYRK